MEIWIKLGQNDLDKNREFGEVWVLWDSVAARSRALSRSLTSSDLE